MSTDREIEAYRELIRQQLAETIPEGLIKSAQGGGLEALREIYRLLGSKDLLAPSWSHAQGGRDMPPWAAITSYEEILGMGIPDTPHILSVQIVGRLLRYHSGTGQWDHILRSIARGDTFSCVLYSEPWAGSDLSSIRTTATPEGDDYIIAGTKLLSLYAHEADVGLVLARDASLDASGNPYSALSLFLTDMRSEAISVRTLRSLQDEQFCEVRLRECRVPATNRVGPAGTAWSTLDEGLAAERTGLDHAARARRWLHAARSCRPNTDSNAGTWGVLEARCDAVTAWARAKSLKAEAAAIRTSDVADLKIAASEVARDVVLTALASSRLDRVRGDDRTVLEAAIREAPGLCLSAGTTEMMYETIVSVLSENWEDMLSPAPLSPEPDFYQELSTSLSFDVGRRLHPEIREDEKRKQIVGALLTSTGLDRLRLTDEDGGLGLPRSYEVTLSYLLGSYFFDDPQTSKHPGDPTDTAGRLLGASAQALQETWRYMRTRRQFGKLLSELPAVSYPLVACLVDLRVAAGALRRLVDGSSTVSNTAVYALCSQTAIKTVTQCMQAAGTQAMTERSPLGTAYAYVMRTVWDASPLFDHESTTLAAETP